MAETFHWADYLVFCLSLAFSSGIGIYHAVQGRRVKSADDYLMAGRSMHAIPVGMSLFVSWISAISFLGDPTEVYYYGGVYGLIGVGYMAAIPFIAHFFAPRFYRLKQISAYQFLKQQYNVHMRTFASVALGFKLVIYLGVALYAPCVALSQMTGLDTSFCILIVGGICAFYTSLGGMKAVLWADTAQALIMMAGLLACLIQGSIAVGGMGEVIRIAREGNRFTLTNIDPNPLVRATVWGYLFGGFFRVLAPYASNQVFIQRYCTVKSERDMKLALYLNIPLFAIFVSIFTLIGLTMFAYYKDCDPLLQGRIQKADQIMPLMVMETLGHVPGVPGLFLACICSAALSTISSGQNALAATTLDDVIQPLYKKWRNKNMRPRTAKFIAMVLSLGFGVLNIAFAFLTLQLRNTTIFALTSKIVGSLAGPMAGLFVLAIICPFVDAVSAVSGCLAAIVFLFWLVVGGTLDPPPLIANPLLALTTKGCPRNDTTNDLLNTTVGVYYSSVMTTVVATAESQQDSLNPVLFGAFGFSLAFLLGLIFGTIRQLAARHLKKNSGTYENQPTDMIYAAEMDPMHEMPTLQREK